MDVYEAFANVTPLLFDIQSISQQNGSCPGGSKPRSSRYLSEINSGEVTITIACCLVAIASVLLYVEELYHFTKNLRRWRTRHFALVLLAIYPVTSFNSMINLLVPRSMGLTALATSTFYGCCVFLFTQMIFHHFGGKKKMLTRIGSREINLQSPPCCCCLVCLPRPTVTLHRLNVLEACVLQYVIIRPLLMYVAAIVAIDAGPDVLLGTQTNSNVFYQVLSLVNLISTCIAVYANTMLFRLANLTLSHVHIKAKFFLLQGCILLETLQRLFIDLLVAVNVLQCQPPLDVAATATRLHDELLIIEMIFFAVAARIYYRHGVSDDADGLQLASDPTPGSTTAPTHDDNLANQSHGNGTVSDDAVVTSQIVSSNSHSGTYGALELKSPHAFKA